MKMAISNNNNDPETVQARKQVVAKLLTCSICKNIINDPFNITECLHIFCRRCICKKIEEENLNRCPVCSVSLGSMPLAKLRPDHTWSTIREKITPSPAQEQKVDDEVSSGEAEQSVSSPVKRKKRLLSSLVNKGNISSPYSFSRKGKGKSSGRKVFSSRSQGSDLPIDNLQKPMDGHLESLRLTKNLKKSAQYNKKFSTRESSKQKIRRKGKESTKKTELVSNLLKPLTEAENIRNYDKTVTKEVSSTKAMDISNREAKSSGKNLRSCDDATRPIRKNQGKTKTPDEAEGLRFLAQTVVDATSNEHEKKVTPVWLSLISSTNQKQLEPLPQLSRSYLMIKDATLPVSFIEKYLSQRLGLDSEEEVEISLQDSPLPSILELHEVVNLWLRKMSNSEKFSLKVGDSAKKFVMVLSYGRK